MEILGYTDTWSLPAGGTVSVHASLAAPGFFEAELVRILGGSRTPGGFDVRTEPAGLHGRYEGRPQDTLAGSHGRVPPSAALDGLDGFVLTVAIAPTLPSDGPQCVLCCRDPVSGTGFSLELDGGLLVVRTGAGEGHPVVAGTYPLAAGVWFRVGLAVGRSGVDLALADRHGTPIETVGCPAALATGGPIGWLFGAAHRPGGGVHHPFAGKMEGPRLQSAHGLVAAWDFSEGIGTDAFGDTGPNGLAGRFVQAPTRAVTGSGWTGEHHDWRQRPEHYNAVHFHPDDLDDAGWPAAFTWRLPEDLAPGVYAVRLSACGDVDHLPLFVHAPPGRPRPAVAVLVPTATYLAYGNDHQAFDKPAPERGTGRPIVLQPADLYLDAHRELGLSLYDRHADGSGVVLSSMRRPLLTQRPCYRRWDAPDGFGQRWLGLDLCLVDWLNDQGIAFDVVTDERLDLEGAAVLASVAVAITGSQPEYASTRMRDALAAWTDSGGRLMYLGGNGFYWRVGFQQDARWRVELRRGFDGAGAWVNAPGEGVLASTGEPGGTWRTLGRPPQGLVGVGFVAEGFTRSGPYERTEAGRLPATAFVFDGVPGTTFGAEGLAGGGAAGIELDAARADLGTPRGAIVLATAAAPSASYQPCVLEERDPPPPGAGGDGRPRLRADMVIFETGHGGAVFATGSIAWIGALPWNGCDNDVSRITRNVLERFLVPEPLGLPR